jgi:hypothetical protein
MIICDFRQRRVRSMGASGLNWIVERTTQNWMAKEQSQVPVSCSDEVQRIRIRELEENSSNKLSDKSVWHQVLFNHWLSDRDESAARQQTRARFGNTIIFIDSRSSRMVIIRWIFGAFRNCFEVKCQFKLLRFAHARRYSGPLLRFISFLFRMLLSHRPLPNRWRTGTAPIELFQVCL